MQLDEKDVLKVKEELETRQLESKVGSRDAALASLRRFQQDEPKLDRMPVHVELISYTAAAKRH